MIFTRGAMISVEELVTHNKKYLKAIISCQTALFVGVLLRLLLFTLDDSLWRDEAMLLMGLPSVSIPELFKELPYAQRCPLALALLWKCMMGLGMTGAHWMRLPSLAAGIAQLFIFALLARMIFSQAKSQPNVVIWLAAVAPQLILFSNQTKPYIFDVLCATLLIFLALPFFLGNEQQSQRYVPLILASWFSLTISYPATFVVGGICAGLLIKNGLRKPRPLLALCLGTAIIVLLSLTLAGESSSYMQSFWEKGYEGFPKLHVVWWVRALAHSLFFGLSSPSYLGIIKVSLFFGWLFAPLCALGSIHLWRTKQHGLLCVLLSPLLFCLSASFFHRYPFHSRLILFTMPHVFILLSYGIIHVSSYFRLKLIVQWGLWTAVALCCIISIVEYSYPCKGIRHGLSYIASREKPGDKIIVDLYASQVVRYYQMLAHKDQRVSFPHADLMYEWQDQTKSKGRPTPDEIVNWLPAKSRIWVLAEADQYHRNLTPLTRTSVQIMNGLLMRSRKVVHSLEVPRVLVICFSNE
jgi:hypothetical protein